MVHSAVFKSNQKQVPLKELRKSINIQSNFSKPSLATLYQLRQMLQMTFWYLMASVKWPDQLGPHWIHIPFQRTEHPSARMTQNIPSAACLLQGVCLCVSNEILESFIQHPLVFVYQATVKSNLSFTFSTPLVFCGVFNQKATTDFWTVKYDLAETVLKNQTNKLRIIPSLIINKTYSAFRTQTKGK